LHVLREVDVARYNDDSRCFYGMMSRQQRCGAYLGEANVEGAFAVVGYSVAAAAFATSAILFVTVRPAPDSRANGAPFGVGLDWHGSF
jgi:hypothetical protein